MTEQNRRIKEVRAPGELDWDEEIKSAAPASADNPSTAGARDVFVPRATLLMIYDAMNYMGDILNGMDACEEEDEEATTPAFNAMRALLDNSYVAAPVAQSTAGAAKPIGWITTGDVEYGSDGPEIGDWDIEWDHKLIDSMPEFCVPETTYGVYLAAPAAQAPTNPDAERWQFLMRAAGDFNGPEAGLMNEFTEWSIQSYGDGEKDQRPQSVILTEVVDKAREKFAEQSSLGEKGGDDA